MSSWRGVVLIFGCFILASSSRATTVLPAPVSESSRLAACARSVRNYGTSLLNRIRFSVTPRMSESRLSWRTNQDRRLAWLDFARASSTLEVLDNFSSPATQSLIFKMRPDGNQRQEIHRILDGKILLTEYLQHKGVEISPTLDQLLTDLELRFRIAVALIARARSIEGVAPPSEQEYLETLAAYARSAVTEISSRFGSKAWLERKIPDLIDSAEFLKSFGGNASYRSVVSNHLEQKRISEPFLETLKSSDKDLDETIRTISKWLNEEVERLPVGIFLSAHDQMNTVRLGGSHFYGSLGVRKAVDRDAYLKEGGTGIEATLNLSNSKKKDLAIDLDQHYRSLDRIFSDGTRCSGTIDTCASFAPRFFLRNGVFVSPPFLMFTSGPILFLKARQILGSRRVEKVEIRNGNKDLKTALKPIIRHEIAALAADAILGMVAVAAIVVVRGIHH